MGEILGNSGNLGREEWDPVGRTPGILKEGMGEILENSMNLGQKQWDPLGRTPEKLLEFGKGRLGSSGVELLENPWNLGRVGSTGENSWNSGREHWDPG